MDKQQSLSRESGARVAAWLAAVDAVAPGGWGRVADPAEIPEGVLADSHHWCDQVFSPGANPHDAPDVARAVHRGGGCSPDLVRYDYVALGFALHVVEGRNFLLIRVDRRSLDLLALPEPERSAAVACAATALLSEPLRFCHCDAFADGALFCTDPRADPLLLASWAERAEGGIRDGELWFCCYKRLSQRVGFANPAQWFSDTAREIRRSAPRGAPRRRSRP